MLRDVQKPFRIVRLLASLSVDDEFHVLGDILKPTLEDRAFTSHGEQVLGPVLAFLGADVHEYLSVGAAVYGLEIGHAPQSRPALGQFRFCPLSDYAITVTAFCPEVRRAWY